MNGLFIYFYAISRKDCNLSRSNSNEDLMFAKILKKSDPFAQKGGARLRKYS